MARTRRARGSDTDRPERRLRPRTSLPPSPPSTVATRQTVESNGGRSSSEPQRRLRRRPSLPSSPPAPRRSYRGRGPRTRRDVALISMEERRRLRERRSSSSSPSPSPSPTQLRTPPPPPSRQGSPHPSLDFIAFGGHGDDDVATSSLSSFGDDFSTSFSSSPSSSSSSFSSSSSSFSSSSSSCGDTGDDDDSHDSNGVNSRRDVDSAAVTPGRYCGPDLSKRVVMNFIDESNVDNVMDNLDCTVCFETMLPPVYQCCNGHAVCGICKSKLENQCPTCRCQRGFFRCTPFEKLAASFRFHCRYRELGCLETFPYGTVEHEMNCKFGLYDCSCPKSKCKVSGGIPGIVYHMISVHKCEESTLPMKFIFRQRKRCIVPPCWKPRIYEYMGHHFLFDFEALKNKKDCYVAFLMYFGEDSIAKTFRYTLKIGNNDWKRIYKGTPRSIRAGYQAIVDSCDGLVFSRSSIPLHVIAGDHPPSFVFTGKISRSQN